MKVEIWHKREEEGVVRFVKGQTITLASVSDETTCELAYLHTSNGSLPRLQDKSGLVPANGDLFLLEDEDAAVPPRCYTISLVGECCNAPEFSLVDCPDNLRG